MRAATFARRSERAMRGMLPRVSVRYGYGRYAAAAAAMRARLFPWCGVCRVCAGVW